MNETILKSGESYCNGGWLYSLRCWIIKIIVGDMTVIINANIEYKSRVDSNISVDINLNEGDAFLDDISFNVEDEYQINITPYSDELPNN